MEKKVQKKYIIIAAIVAALLMFIIQWFMHMPYESCSQIPQGFNRPCSAIINSYIIMPGSAVLALAMGFLILKKERYTQPFIVSLFAVLFLWIFGRVIFWLPSLLTVIPIYLLTAVGLFMVSDVYFTKWRVKLWIKVAIAVILLATIAFGVGMLDVL
jgi:hypothetical protein